LCKAEEVRAGGADGFGALAILAVDAERLGLTILETGFFTSVFFSISTNNLRFLVLSSS
jgi:hypothetical protein